MKILFKFPSKSRPEKFFSVIENITDLSRSEDYSILATFDINDPLMANEDVKNRLIGYSKIKSIYGTSLSKIDACNRDMGFSGDWDILVLVSDDYAALFDD